MNIHPKRSQIPWDVRRHVNLFGNSFLFNTNDRDDRDPHPFSLWPTTIHLPPHIPFDDDPGTPNYMTSPPGHLNMSNDHQTGHHHHPTHPKSPWRVGIAAAATAAVGEKQQQRWWYFSRLTARTATTSTNASASRAPATRLFFFLLINLHILY